MRTTVAARCLAGLAVALGLAVLACNQGSEGDRCNPVTAANGHDECGSGLHCRSDIPGCPEAYCCPSDLSTSEDPFCKPGCNGGAASACNAGNADACALACSVDRADLADARAQCPASPKADASTDVTPDSSPDVPNVDP